MIFRAWPQPSTKLAVMLAVGSVPSDARSRTVLMGCPQVSRRLL
jgi:hypothetical protein